MQTVSVLLPIVLLIEYYRSLPEIMKNSILYALIKRLEQNQDFFSLLLGNDEMKKKVLEIFSDKIYNSLKNVE